MLKDFPYFKEMLKTIIQIFFGNLTDLFLDFQGEVVLTQELLA